MKKIAIIALITLSPARSLAESPRDYAFELKFGPYRPQADSEHSLGGAHPFEDIYGAGNAFMTQVEIDVELWRGFGTAGIGGSTGFVQHLGKGLFKNGERSNDTTAFNVMPCALSLVYRFDYLQYKLGLPVVPFAKAGFAYYFWWITDAEGETSSAKGFNGKGGSAGLQYQAGLQLLLDSFDEKSAMNLDVDFGVNNTYIFAEYFKAEVHDFNDHSLVLSDVSFMAGIMMEF